MDVIKKLQREVEQLEGQLVHKRAELENAEARANDRGWEVAWYQQLLLVAGCAVDPETLKDGLTYDEAQVERLKYIEYFRGAVGMAIIVRRSPPKEESGEEETVL